MLSGFHIANRQCEKKTGHEHRCSGSKLHTLVGFRTSNQGVAVLRRLTSYQRETPRPPLPCSCSAPALIFIFSNANITLLVDAFTVQHCLKIKDLLSNPLDQVTLHVTRYSLQSSAEIAILHVLFDISFTAIPIKTTCMPTPTKMIS